MTELRQILHRLVLGDITPKQAEAEMDAIWWFVRKDSAGEAVYDDHNRQRQNEIVDEMFPYAGNRWERVDGVGSDGKP